MAEPFHGSSCGKKKSTVEDLKLMHSPICLTPKTYEQQPQLQSYKQTIYLTIPNQPKFIFNLWKISQPRRQYGQ